ncbi:MAG: aminotransferase class I/II-fold pyridoxal phosphate-dependent enzyme [Synergistaceae bacterium]|jgi:lysine decarboxylase|nr:aminotransferase class I/II-fold pyridoxal phosphate-dependent enzyme [Synergistaceae bacterium]
MSTPDIGEKKLTQSDAPLHIALADYRSRRVVPFDVPGHKQGRGTPGLTEFLGKSCLSVDVNSMKPLDNLSHPTSVIRDAETLAAEAFGADSAFMMVGGTTSAVQAMIMSVCKGGDSIIIPRNVHRSAINALILCGIKPVYVDPGTHPSFGISLGMDASDVEDAMRAVPDAKAVFVNNPTYYGVCPDMRRIVEAAHSRGMAVLADEAHGAHFYFGEEMPVSAMSAGADMSSISMHKTGGSLTQSSFLVTKGGRVDPAYVRTIINLTQTTSASYLLMSSLDIARKELATNGAATFRKVRELADYARGEINGIGGYCAFSREIINGRAVCDFDVTKLSVHTLGIGLAGIEVYDLLRDDYGIQIEFGDMGNLLAIISVGDNYYAIERLVSSLAEIRRLHNGRGVGLWDHEYVPPVVKLSPQEAFYAPYRRVSLVASEGEISSEFVMCYPPGIPILAPGELITPDVLGYILYAKEKGSLVMGPQDMTLEYINVAEREVL